MRMMAKWKKNDGKMGINFDEITLDFRVFGSDLNLYFVWKQLGINFDENFRIFCLGID